ncbi:response regulator transcription factor [Nonomuraea sp. NPDC049504]|uniref:response regulator transcription factor n=1 Tax=Nonomuraea sp. NPDC049504 TaxID=3154729 RepID=UPI0034460E46
MRVIVADDAVLLREGLSRLLAEAGFEIAGTAADHDGLLTLVEAERPDVAVVDIRMPPTYTDEGLRAAREIRARHPATGVLVLSQHVRVTYALELFGHDPRGVGYLLKDRVADLEELTAAVRRVARGGSALDPEVVALLLGRRQAADGPATMTNREREVLALMAEGRSNGAIARRLGIAERTVEKHIAAVFGKLQIPAHADDHRRVLAVLAHLRR